MRDMCSILAVATLLLAVVFVSMPAASPVGIPAVKADNPSGSQVIAQNIVVEPTGNCWTDPRTGLSSANMICEYKAVIDSAPSYMPDLETPIDTQWYPHYATGEYDWYSGTNLFEVTVKDAKVTVEKDTAEHGKQKLKFDPIVVIGDKHHKPDPTYATRLYDDPINENYGWNTLEWDYGVCIRHLRIIEGALIETFTFDTDPGDDVHILSNLYKDPNFVWDKPPYAYDANGNPLEISEDKVVLASEFANAAYPVVIDPSTYFYSTEADGYLLGFGKPYSTIHDLETATALYHPVYNSRVGQTIDANEDYRIWRSFIYFDTAGMPDDCTISSAKLKLYGDGDYAQWDFDVTIQSGMPAYPHNPLVKGDYLYSQYSGNGGEFNTAGWSTMGYNDITLSETGLTWITKTEEEGETKFCLRSSRDISATPPIYDPGYTTNWVSYFCSTYGTGKWPQLEVTYYVAPTVPEAETLEAVSVWETTARLVGRVTEDGGGPCWVWFKYGLEDTYGLETEPEPGYYTTAYFTHDVDGLYPGQLYHCQAQVENAEESGHGDDVTFFTLPCEPDGLSATPGDEHIYLDWDAGDGVQKYMVRYKTTGAYPSSPTDGDQAYFGTSTFYDHTDLSNEAVYRYSIWSYATEGGLEEYSYSYTSAFAQPYEDTIATVETHEATDVTQTTATLNGKLTGMGGYASVDVKFQYYETGGSWTDHETTPETKTSLGLFSAPVSDLDPDSPYHVRAVATNGAGPAYGIDKPFTTGGISAPTLLTQATTDLTMTSAKLHGKVSDDGGADVTVWFEWGLDANYGETSTTAGPLLNGDTIYFNLDDLEKNTTYHYSFAGENSAGEAYGGDITFDTTAPGLPSVTTQAADVGANSATLKGLLVSDGDEACEVRFQWYAEDEAQWAHDTGWQPGKETSDSFEQYITDLEIGKTYRYRAQAQNSGGLASGESMSFVTVFSEPTGFSATAIASYAIKLKWTPGGAQTYIVMKPTGYPADRTDGELVYFGASNEYILMGLEPGETYWFKGWSWKSASVFSDNYAVAMATTLAEGMGDQDPPVIVTVPDEPSRWDADPDPTMLEGVFLYDSVNDVADAIGMPHGTFWLLLAVLWSVILGIGVFYMAHSATISTIAMGLALLGGWWLWIVPLWIVAVFIVMGVGVVYLEKRL